MTSTIIAGRFFWPGESEKISQLRKANLVWSCVLGDQVHDLLIVVAVETY
jgi:hypothetical protein